MSKDIGVSAATQAIGRALVERTMETLAVDREIGCRYLNRVWQDLQNAGIDTRTIKERPSRIADVGCKVLDGIVENHPEMKQHFSNATNRTTYKQRLTSCAMALKL